MKSGGKLKAKHRLKILTRYLMDTNDKIYLLCQSLANRSVYLRMCSVRYTKDRVEIAIRERHIIEKMSENHLVENLL